MKTFTNWLKQNRHSATTIKAHLENLERINNWLEQENSSLQMVCYQDLLQYVKQEQKRKINPSTINLHLASIDKYYQYLVKTGQSLQNPARHLRVKYNRHKLRTNLFSQDELEDIYTYYTSLSGFREEKGRMAHHRNKVILGLLIYQGADTAVLKKLQVEHVKIDKGFIQLPGSKKSAARLLPLQSKQILPLHHYMQIIRPCVMDQNDSRLFYANQHVVMQGILKTIKKAFPSVENVYQIRASVIVQWLKEHDIRQVQYLAGHKHISSTENFKQEDIEGLQKGMAIYHPFR